MDRLQDRKYGVDNEVTIPEYVLFKLFAIFRDQLSPIINSYRNFALDTELWKHIFLSPEKLARLRAQQNEGEFPLIALWPTSPLEFQKDPTLYYRSQVPHVYIDCCTGQELYLRMGDFEIKLSLYASSYDAPFCHRVNQDVLLLDVQRFVKVPIEEVACGMTTTAEFKIESLRSSEELDERTTNRAFSLHVDYKVKISIPLWFYTPQIELTNLNIFMDSIKIYDRSLEKPVVTVPIIPPATP